MCAENSTTIKTKQGSSIDCLASPCYALCTLHRQKLISWWYRLCCLVGKTAIIVEPMQQIVNYPGNKNRNRFAEPTSVKIGIGIVREFQNLQIGIGIIFVRW